MAILALTKNSLQVELTYMHDSVVRDTHVVQVEHAHCLDYTQSSSRRAHDGLDPINGLQRELEHARH